MNKLALIVAAAVILAGKAQGSPIDDEIAIRALNEVFAQGMVKKDPKLRASVFLEDATLLPPNAGFLTGREAIEKHFQSEVPSFTENSKATFSDYRFRFINRDLAFVDTELTVNNIIGPDGKLYDAVRVNIVFTAVRRGGKWLIQDERTHFEPMAPPK
jgi:uncharacterized protein (TIGR02246 family)